MTKEELSKSKKELFPKVIFFEGWVAITNFNKYNTYSGEKNDKARERQLNLIPYKFIDYLRSIDTSIYTSIYTTHNTNHNHNHNTNTKKIAGLPTIDELKNRK